MTKRDRRKAKRRSSSVFPLYRKKGQMEVIGLVVIVILISLGLLFMAQFALKSDPKKKVFVRKGLAYSTMSAMMKLDINCTDYNDNYRVKPLKLQGDLLQDCTENFGYYDSKYQCNGQHSCDYVNETITYLLNETLGRWNKHYEFKSSLLSGIKPEIILQIKDGEGKGCPLERDTSGLFPLNTGVGLIENVLYLCD